MSVEIIVKTMTTSRTYYEGEPEEVTIVTRYEPLVIVNEDAEYTIECIDEETATINTWTIISTDATSIKFTDNVEYILEVDVVQGNTLLSLEKFLANASSLVVFNWTEVVCNVTNFYGAWYRCLSLVTFPMMDMSNGLDFGNTWGDCQNLTAFPLIDTSSGTDFHQAWYRCKTLITFPAIDVSLGTTFEGTWRNCINLKTMPALNTETSQDFSDVWRDCTNLECVGGYVVVQHDLPNAKTTKTDDMFLNCYSLLHPSESQIGEVELGDQERIDYSYSC